MRFFPLASTLATLLALTGCAFHRTPYPMMDSARPPADTAVFSALDDKGIKFVDSRIPSVDGKETSCIEVGCPYWVRVAPGSHSFVVHYTSNFSWGFRTSGYSYAKLNIDIPDMQPRHVYVARYKEFKDRVEVRIEDLGENPSYGITLGLDGANKQFYPVKF